jgi:hypothetical protein
MENQTGGVLLIRLEKKYPMIGTPIMNAAIAFIAIPTFSKKSRRVEAFFACEPTGGWLSDSFGIIAGLTLKVGC